MYRQVLYHFPAHQEGLKIIVEGKQMIVFIDNHFNKFLDFRTHLLFCAMGHPNRDLR